MSVQTSGSSPTLPIVHTSNDRFYLDECEGGGYILIDWDELDPPEGSPGAVEYSDEEVWERHYKKWGYPPGVVPK